MIISLLKSNENDQAHTLLIIRKLRIYFYFLMCDITSKYIIRKQMIMEMLFFSAYIIGKQIYL